MRGVAALAGLAAAAAAAAAPTGAAAQPMIPGEGAIPPAMTAAPPAALAGFAPGAAAPGTAPQQAQFVPGGGAQQQQQQFVPAGPPPTGRLISPDQPLARRESRNVGMATAWRQRACTPERDPAGVLRFQGGACEITVVCAVLRVCSIALEPGELVTSTPDIGDPRWITHLRVAGTGAAATYNIAVKPTDAGLDTTMVFHTTRRTVSFRLVSHSRNYMPLVAIEDGLGRARGEWASAAAFGTAMAARGAGYAGNGGGNVAGAFGAAGGACAQPPVVPPSGFSVTASGWFASDPPWTPTQVYAVPAGSSQATCIEFPADFGSMSSPVLVAYDANGAPRTLNVRRFGRHWLVDGVVTRATLIAPDQTKVKIERRG